MLGKIDHRGRCGHAVGLTPTRPAAAERPANEPFGYCLNTSTIRGQKLTLPAEIDIAARAGYQGIEPWVNEIDSYVQSGGSLADLRKRMTDQGLSVEGVIGFADWVVDDEQQRAKGLEEARRIMDLTTQIGGTRIAAPPAGLKEGERPDLDAIADRYRALLELGDKQGVVPQLELWGFAPRAQPLERRGLRGRCQRTSAGLHPGGHLSPVQRRLGLREPAVALRGGAGCVSHQRLSGEARRARKSPTRPASFPATAWRRWPRCFGTLREIGYRGMLSLEVFNREYWNQDALYVARAGLEKTRDGRARRRWLDDVGRGQLRLRFAAARRSSFRSTCRPVPGSNMWRTARSAAIPTCWWSKWTKTAKCGCGANTSKFALGRVPAAAQA